MSTIDPVSELQRTNLYRHLLKLDPRYANNISTFVETIAPVLVTTVDHFPYYTRHDAQHGWNVVKRIEEVVLPECLKIGGPLCLSAAETFLLIAAAYAHDLGMTVFPGEADALLRRLGVPKDATWRTDPRLQDHLRKEHSKRGGEYILSNASALALPIPLVGTLDKMMRAHNLGLAELEAELRKPHAAQGKEVQVLQLAVILCVADAIEFSDTRVIDGVLDQIAADPSDAARYSYRENMKHVCVGDSLAVREHGGLLVSGTFTEPDVLALAHRTLDEIEHWIRGYCDLDRRFKTPRLRVRPEAIERNLDFKRGRFERLGIRLKKKNVLDLIASNAVWRGEQGIALRELVQNAVEACRYRAYHSAVSDAYAPAVQVTFDRASHSIMVEDNGCGMTEGTVLNNLLTVGNSRANEPGYTASGYSPIARFGIGFWSVFTIAERATVFTAAFGRASETPASGFGFDVSLGDLEDYTVFRPHDRQPGTSIELKLKGDVVMDDVFAAGSEMLLRSEVPVSFKIDGNVVQVPPRLPDVPEAAVMGERGTQLRSLGVQLFHWHGEKGGLQMSLVLGYRMSSGKASFMADGASSLLTLFGGLRYPRTGVAGFSVATALPSLCIDVARIGTFVADHRDPKGFEFSLDRRELLRNSAAISMKAGISDLFHEGYRAFLDRTSSMDFETITDLREQAAMHGGNVYDTFTGEELMDAARRYPDLLTARLWPATSSPGLDGVVPVCADIQTLRGMSGTVWFIQSQPQPLAGWARHIDLEGESGVRIASAATTGLAAAGVPAPAYLMAADRVASMLFDADPESTVHFANDRELGTLCIQSVDLGQVSYTAAPRNILAEVQGRWSGTVYSRRFAAPGGNPYVFLGRYRVLVTEGSRLARRIQSLWAEGKKIQIANLVADLTEHGNGFDPASLRGLL